MEASRPSFFGVLGALGQSPSPALKIDGIELNDCRKTQIALSFAHSVDEKLSVFWMRAETYSSFIDDFCQILKLVKPSDALPIDQVAVAEKTRTFLESSFQDWLLVLDNADTFDDFVKNPGSEQSIRRFVPRNGRVLITTRDPRFLGSFAPAMNGLRVRPMDPEEAKKLLITSLPGHLTASLKESDVQNLLYKLGNLPLGIAQAAANIDDLQLTLVEFVRAYEDKENRMELMQLPFQDFQTFDPHTTSQSIFVTWEMSFERLQETAPLAATCLNYMGILHWRRIPKRIVMRLPEFRCLRPHKFQAVVKRLLHLSLIEAAETEQDWIEYDVHPLMHERIFQRQKITDAKRYSLSVVDVIGSIFPVIPWHKNGSETEDARSLAGYLLPHTLRLIELVKILAIRSQDCARLLQTVGGFLTMIGRPFLGSIVAMKALEMAPNVFDVNEASIHYIRRYAINSLVANAQYAEAEKECRVALKTLDSPEFQSHHNKASLLMERHTVLTHQIGALRGVQKYAEAENSYIAIERIWTELRNMVSSEGEEIDLARDRATQVHNLANVIQSQGRIDEARRLIEESLKIIDSIRNTNGSKEIASMDRTYTTMMNLKAQIMLQSLQETDLSFEIADKQRYEAQNIFMSSFQKCFDLFGVTDIDTWKAANFCVGIMFDRKQYNEAMDILLKMGLAAKTADMAIEGQKLETFAITFHDVISLGSILRIIYNANMRTKAAMITQVYEYLVETKAAESIVKYTAPVQLNNYAVSLIQKGCFRHAERVLKELLPKNSTDTFIVEYYNLMLAISRQPGRQGEAYRFREQHIDKIASAEATYGDLTTRLRRDEEDLTTYEEAKTKIENGQLAFGDAWWTEHEEALSRAEFRYEILFDDVPYEDSEANTPPMDSTTKGILMEMAESRR